jgi:hypothetical protein
VLPGSLTALGAGTASAEGRVRDGGVDLTRAQATWRGLAITLGGRLCGGPPLAVGGTLTADLKEIARALSLGALSGHATVAAALSGRGQTAAVEGRAEVAALDVQGHAVEPIEASFRLAASPGPDSRWEGTIQSPRIRSDQLAIEQITAALAVDGERLQITRARARAAAVPVEATGVWEWAGSGRSHAELGPVALGAITGVPPALRLWHRPGHRGCLHQPWRDHRDRARGARSGHRGRRRAGRRASRDARARDGTRRRPVVPNASPASQGERPGRDQQCAQ